MTKGAALLAIIVLGVAWSHRGDAASVTLPAGFVVAPAIAENASDRANGAATGVEVKAHAWKHDALGCYAVIQTTRLGSSANPAAVHRSITRELETSGVRVADTVYDESIQISRFGFSRDSLRGKAIVRSTTVDGTQRVGFASCFYRPRRAARCEQLCDDMLERYETQQ